MSDNIINISLEAKANPKLNFTVEEPKDVYTDDWFERPTICLLYTSPSPRDQRGSRMPSSA